MDELAGLPVWCEKILDGDLVTAELKGLTARLYARYAMLNAGGA